MLQLPLPMPLVTTLAVSCGRNRPVLLASWTSLVPFQWLKWFLIWCLKEWINCQKLAVSYKSWKVEWDQGKNNLNNNWIKFAIIQNYEVVKLILHFWYEVNRVKIISLSVVCYHINLEKLHEFKPKKKKKSQIDNRKINFILSKVPSVVLALQENIHVTTFKEKEKKYQ